VSAVGRAQSPTSDPDPRNNTSTVTTKVRYAPSGTLPGRSGPSGAVRLMS
jgi:hypothetical protein